MRWILSLVFAAAALTAFSQPPMPKAEPAPVDSGVSVYRHVLHSSVWIHSDRGSGRLATGSGSLIDKGRRLVLTNYHVVGDVKTATVFFPEFGSDKRVVPERKYYLDRRTRLGIPGEVVEVDKEGDLALIRLDRVPDGVPGLPLAAASPEPGQTVHSIGNPGKSGALWVYTPGKVRQVYNKKWQARLDEKHVLTFQAKVIETDSPTNPGDSGGPLVNDQGELVGVTQGGAIDAQALSIFVDLSEVKRLLNRRSVQALRSTESVAARAEEKREAPLKSKDDGKFFSEEAWKKVQAAAEKLLKEKRIDLQIETFTTLPDADAEKLKAMSADERGKAYKAFAEKRAKEEKLDGIYIAITKSPGHIFVHIGGRSAASFPADFGPKLTKSLLSAFREKKFDDGLNECLNLILSAQGLGEKK